MEKKKVKKDQKKYEIEKKKERHPRCNRSIVKNPQS